MKIVIASDSYKGCLSSKQVAAAASKAVREKYPDAEILELAVADGGEGTVEALIDSFSGVIVNAEVSDPLGRKIIAGYGVAADLAVIEVSAACGLALLKTEERNPLLTTTKGVGELILDAVSRGCRRFLIGLGGSATNDGGRGMIEVPGFLEKTRGLEFTVACDVDTPFIGPDGTSRVFGPQKGASSEDIGILESRLSKFADEIESMTGVDVRQIPGAGAAGGLGGAFRAFLGASLVPGVDMVLDAIDFESRIEGADLVITGEGRSDFQTPKGKTPSGVLSRSMKKGVPVALVSGAVRDIPQLQAIGFSKIIAATPENVPIEDALRQEVAEKNIYAAVLKILDY